LGHQKNHLLLTDMFNTQFIHQQMHIY